MVDSPERLLQARDGRYFAIDDFGGGLALFTKAERLNKKTIVDFPLPSGPALFLSLAVRAFRTISDADTAGMFYKWENGLIPVNNSVMFDYFEQFVAHVVFSITALEAFANEAIPSDYVHTVKRQGVEKQLRKADIERSVTLDEKLDRVLPKALGVTSPKGKKLWQRFQKLKTMRDRIIHLKTIDRSASNATQESVWGMMLRSHGEPFCAHAHAVIAHYAPATNRRWFREYPYSNREPDFINRTESVPRGEV